MLMTSIEQVKFVKHRYFILNLIFVITRLPLGE